MNAAGTGVSRANVKVAASVAELGAAYARHMWTAIHPLDVIWATRTLPHQTLFFEFFKSGNVSLSFIAYMFGGRKCYVAFPADA